MPAWPVSQREIDLLKTRQQVRVEVVKAEQYDPDFPSGPFEQVIERLGEIFKEIPEQYRAKAAIEFESVSSYYDSHYCHMTIYYYRDETDEEMDARRKDVEKRQRAYEQDILRQAALIKKGDKK